MKTPPLSVRVPVKRCLCDHPVVWVPLGLLTFAIVAVCSTLCPPEWKRRRDT